MTAFSIICAYEFHPVGQGLFSAGTLKVPKSKKAEFCWVYDCGTSSAQSLLKKAMQHLRTGPFVAGGKPKLDMVVISHFDKDHISGLALLLTKFSVGTLLIPYMPLWQRLVLAFAEGIDSQQQLAQFFVNPVAYVSALPEVSIDRIVLVPPSPTEGPNDGQNVVSVLPQNDGPWKPNFESEKRPSAEQVAEMKEFTDSGQARNIVVEAMRAGSSLQFEAAWEFVPYNDASVSPKPTPKFSNAVQKRKTAFLNAATKEERAKALGQLRDEYDDHFGKSAKQRNVISLFLYGGPLGRRVPGRVLFFLPWIREGRSLAYRRYWQSVERVGVLYTGDGYLDTRPRLNRLKRYLGKSRMEKIACLQVMHHGAKGNWHPGLAKSISPVISVFSSDPVRKGLGHPHAEVLRDFWPFNPMQADAVDGVDFVIQVLYP